MRKPAHLKKLLLICLLIAGLPLAVAALPALAQDATAEATAEITAEATEHVMAEATAEITAEATAEAAAEISPTAAPTQPAPTPAPESEAVPEPVTGLTALIALLGFGGVVAVGVIAWQRERAGKLEDKV
ncbi:MAG: hypothetical protein K8I30_19275 [Anaerolineae bacterium]|nr:hypothetical protein [Anaerolineae bacterium]